MKKMVFAMFSCSVTETLSFKDRKNGMMRCFCWCQHFCFILVLRYFH